MAAPPPAQPPTPAATPKHDTAPRLLEEWKESRAVLARFDNNLHDIRKYGFTFITALLAAQAILIPSEVFQSVEEAGIDDQTKLGVFLATLILINCLGIFDRVYNQFQSAAKTRATIIERMLNLELTESISDLYKIGRIGPYSFFFILLLLEIALMVLAYSVLSNNLDLMYFLVVPAILFPVSFYLYERFYLIGHAMVDISVDKIEVFPGESIRIMVTNISMKDAQLLYKNDALFWKIVDSRGLEICSEKSTGETRLGPMESLTWIWPVPGTQSVGVYTVKMPVGNKEFPLDRRIVVVHP
jgi:hypothetical protein